MNRTEQILEFDKVKLQWEEFALTEAAKEKIRGMEPYLEELALRAAMRETTESKQMLELFGNPPAISMNGLSEALDAAQKGDCLGASQLGLVSSCLAGIGRWKSYLCRGKERQISLAFREETLQELAELRKEIELSILGDSVADNATKLLRTLRGSIMATEQKMREKAENIIRTQKECMSDQFATMRNGHVCIPVKKEHKFKIPGIVIAASATGNTLFVEPVSVAKYYEELQELRLAEENEVRRILYELTALVACYHVELTEDIRVMEKLDFVFSKGKLSCAYDAVEPEITSERSIRLKNARHPLMPKAQCVPLNVSFGNGIQGIVITGPNTGGKTVALKTVALNSMMAQCGLHVTAEATLCMNSNYLCDIGDGQNLSENLSTFSAHITNILEILKWVNTESLVVLDELGSGTDPQEGMGIAIAILEELRASGALFLVTTHYPEVKVYADGATGILNARMDFDKENLKPLYRMVVGEAGESCAFYIAKRLGMSGRMLRRAAQAAYGNDAELANEVRVKQLDGKAGGLPGELEDLLTGSDAEEKKAPSPRIRKKKTVKKKQQEYHLGDSVMVYPDKKIGIVCQPENDKGVLQVQLQKKKIWVNYKRVKLLVPAAELYPEEYDFSIVFDSVETRKLRHKMERKYVEGESLSYEE